jgi:acid phosphatase type 7
VAVGDIVCEPTDGDFGGSDPNECQHRATAKLIDDADAVLGLGDLQYDHGTLGEYLAAYDPTWGRFASITYPAPGNHEHETAGARGYFDYWRLKHRPTGRPIGAYGFDLGSWHLIGLDSSCFAVECAEGSPQDDFLERDLAATSKPCILAYWHHPYFNSGEVHGEEMLPGVRAFWDDLLAARADVILNGHEHDYQRYGKQDVGGRARPDGIREFVVGTGGKSHYDLLEHKDPNYQAGDDTHFGVLKLFLAEDSYRWEFVAVGGAVLDRGGPTRCNA